MAISPPPLDELDIICHGCSAFDFNILTPRFIEPNQKCLTDRVSHNGGGVSANAAVAAARLGGKVGFSGLISSDCFGQVQYQELCSEGINTELVVRGDEPSSVAVIIGQPDGNSFLTGNISEIPYDLPEGFSKVKPRVLLFDGSQKETSLEWITLAKQINAITVLDGSYLTPDSLELAGLVDIVISSRVFGEDYSHSSKRDIMLDKVGDLCERFIITLDKDGLAWIWDGKRGAMGAWQVDCIDGVGAGDAFHGVFCIGLLNGLKLEENLLTASAAGALCCRELGARAALPDINMLQSFMLSQPEPEINFF